MTSQSVRPLSIGLILLSISMHITLFTWPLNRLCSILYCNIVYFIHINAGNYMISYTTKYPVNYRSPPSLTNLGVHSQTRGYASPSALSGI